MSGRGTTSRRRRPTAPPKPDSPAPTQTQNTKHKTRAWISGGRSKRVSPSPPPPPPLPPQSTTGLNHTARTSRPNVRRSPSYCVEAPPGAVAVAAASCCWPPPTAMAPGCAPCVVLLFCCFVCVGGGGWLVCEGFGAVVYVYVYVRTHRIVTPSNTSISYRRVCGGGGGARVPVADVEGGLLGDGCDDKRGEKRVGKC